MSIAAALLGIVFIALGFRSYVGKWQSWAHRTGYGHCTGFALLYFGGALVSAGLLMSLPRGSVPTELLFFTTVPLLWCGIIGVFWLPRFLLPHWFVKARDEQREIERAIYDLKSASRRQQKREQDS